MMLEPVNSQESRLDINLLQFYDEPLQVLEAQQAIHLRLQGRTLVSCSAWWDPSYGSAKGDRSVLAIIFTDEAGHYYLHHMAYLKAEDSTIDAATDQCRQVVQIAKDFFLPSITIENNGIGKFLPAILRREMSVARVPCAVVEKSNSIPKDQRILEAFDAVMAAESLHVHESIRKTPFLQEMMD